jgi:hypothetical protein
METALQVGVAVVAGSAVLYIMLRKLGVGMPGGKPDCGCGSCNTKKRSKAL